MPAVLVQARVLPSAVARTSSSQRPALPARPSLGRAPLRLVSVASASGGSTPSDVPDPKVFLRGTSGTGGGVGGAGGTGGNRPVGTGGSGGGGVPPLPDGWSWNRVLLTLLGIALAVPVWNNIRDNYVSKPEPDHTLEKAEGKVTEKKGKSAASKAASAVKHATVDPIKDAVAAVKHSDTGRSVQHKVEDTKDTVDINLTDLSNKADRALAKGKQEAKHHVDHAKAKVDDIKANVDTKAHEVSVKGSRAVQRGQDKASDVAYDAEKSVEKSTKGFFESIKGAATTVGRKLHVVADATEKGIKSAADKGERATGVKYGTASAEDHKTAIYVGAGVALTVAALIAYDRNGGDIGGKLKKFREKTQDATDTAMSKARDALKGGPVEPAGPKA